MIEAADHLINRHVVGNPEQQPIGESAFPEIVQNVLFTPAIRRIANYAGSPSTIES
jgi:hypothetical protein